MQFKISLFVQMPGPPPPFGSNSCYHPRSDHFRMSNSQPRKMAAVKCPEVASGECWSFELINTLIQVVERLKLEDMVVDGLYLILLRAHLYHKLYISWDSWRPTIHHDIDRCQI